LILETFSSANVDTNVEEFSYQRRRRRRTKNAGEGKRKNEEDERRQTQRQRESKIETVENSVRSRSLRELL
jgi:hypothetical protein